MIWICLDLTFVPVACQFHSVLCLGDETARVELKLKEGRKRAESCEVREILQSFLSHLSQGQCDQMGVELCFRCPKYQPSLY